MTKFKSKKSLVSGVFAGIGLVIIGVVLSLHCIDMMRNKK